MRRELAGVLALAAASVVVRAILGAAFTLEGENFTDQVEYAAMARSLAREGRFLVLDRPSIQYPPFYPAFLAPAAALGGSGTGLLVLAGSVAAASGFVPLWLLARRVLAGRRLWIALAIAAVLPSSLLLPTEIFSEAIFYPLFWWWALAGVRWVERPGAGRAIVWGALLGALVLTRTAGLAFVPALPLLALLESWAGRGSGGRAVGHASVALLVAGALVLPWMLRNLSVHEAAVPVYDEAELSPAEILRTDEDRNFPVELARQLAHLAAGSGLLAFALALPLVGRRDAIGTAARLALVTAFFASVASAYHHHLGASTGVGRMIFGRYVANTYPLLVIAGLAGLARPRPWAFAATAGLVLATFPFPVFRDLETRFLVPVYWAVDSAWAIRAALAAAAVVLGWLACSGRGRLALAATFAWFLIADAWAVAYLHAIGRGVEPLRRFAIEVAEEAPGGAVLLAAEGSWEAEDLPAVWGLLLWGGVEVRNCPGPDVGYELTTEPASGGPWFIPGERMEGWRVVWGRRPTGQSRTANGE